MKKIITLTFFLLIAFKTLLSQSAYQDALKLRNYIVKTLRPGTNDSVARFGNGDIDGNAVSDYKDVQGILSFYTDSASGHFVSTDAIDSIYELNPFVTKYLLVTASSGGSVLTKFSSAIGNINATTFADGLSKFLIKRAKEELLISFFSKLKDDKKIPEFKVLFPRTKKLLENFETWEFHNIINTLREAFNKDFKELLVNIPKLSGVTCTNCTPAAEDRINSLKTFLRSDNGRLLMSAFAIGGGFISDQKIPDVIHTVAGPNFLGGLSVLSADEANILKLLDIISYSVRSNISGEHYISSDQFKALLDDPILRDMYFGLLYQQIKNADITIRGVKVTDLLKPSTLTNFIAYIKGILKNVDDFVTATANLKEARKKGETELANYWAAIFESAQNFLSVAANTEAIDPRFVLPGKLTEVIESAKSTIEIAHDISVKNYSAAVVSILTLISSKLESPDQASEFRKFFVKYASFAANLIEAKNSDEAESAIEAIALPAGSASIKRNSTWNIALNAYIGGFWGNEYLGDKKQGKWSQISGICAPVGITFSHKLKGFSLSAFISLIDVGAFASYRLKDDSTELLPKVSLKNIFAPGLGFVLGLPKVPVSIGYTYQLGPALREINKGDILTSDKANKRWQFFLAVDIPIVNFYNKK